jgi:hypothetical protein
LIEGVGVLHVIFHLLQSQQAWGTLFSPFHIFGLMFQAIEGILSKLFGFLLVLQLYRLAVLFVPCLLFSFGSAHDGVVTALVRKMQDGGK